MAVSKNCPGDSDVPCIKNHCPPPLTPERVKTLAEGHNLPFETNYFMCLVGSISCQYQLPTSNIKRLNQTNVFKMQVKYMDFKCQYLQTHPQPQGGTAQTLRREGTPGPANCRQGLEPHVHNEARSTPPHLKPTDNVLVNSETMHVKDIFHKQVLHFNVT